MLHVSSGMDGVDGACLELGGFRCKKHFLARPSGGLLRVALSLSLYVLYIYIYYSYIYIYLYYSLLLLLLLLFLLLTHSLTHSLAYAAHLPVKGA